MTLASAPAATHRAVRPGATALLDAYRPGPDTAFLAGPHRTLLAEGRRATVLALGGEPLSRAVARSLRAAHARGAAHPIVTGAVPFDSGTAPPRLFIPARAEWAPALRSDPLLGLDMPEPRQQPVWHVRAVPARREYEEAVAAAVARLRSGALDKVVLARTLELTADNAADRDGLLPGMLWRLARRDPDGYTFAVPAGGGRTLIGASPELLVSRQGNRITANPLAGSVPRSADLAEDVCRAAALLQSPKDRHEHALVVQAVRAALGPHCRTLEVPAEPTLVRTAAMWHLSTTVTGEPVDAGVSALDLACALHPTPAVCGTPTDAARALIGELEPFDRGLYTGMVGWQDLDGNGEWVVTIRCAEADDSGLRLFAGAGIVADSRPEAEGAETSAKFRTFLHAAGIEEAL